MLAITVPHAFFFHNMTPPNRSMGAMMEISIAATTLNGSGSMGVGLPAKMCAAHIRIHTIASPIPTKTKNPPMIFREVFSLSLLAVFFTSRSEIPRIMVMMLKLSMRIYTSKNAFNADPNR